MLQFLTAAWAALLVSAGNHPAIAYVIVTAAVNGFFDLIKAEGHKFWLLRALDAGMSFAGVDAVKLTKLVLGLLGGKVPPGPGPSAKATIIPPPLPTTVRDLPRVGASDPDMTPTTPSPSRLMLGMRLAWLRAALVAGTALSLSACGALATQEKAARYESLQLECVDSSQTKAEADDCRCGVKRAFGRACADAGADAAVDGGGGK